MPLIVGIECIFDEWMTNWIQGFCSIWLNRHNLRTNSGPATEVDIGYRVNKTDSATKKKRKRENGQAHSGVRQKAGVSALPVSEPVLVEPWLKRREWERATPGMKALRVTFYVGMGSPSSPRISLGHLAPRRKWQPIEADKMIKGLPSEYSKYCHLGETQ